MSEPATRAPLPKLTLVLGGARSGKSRHAERLILASGLKPVYLATAEALDAEMAERIDRHRQRRTDAWRTVEAPLDLVGALQQECVAGHAVLVDCLTLWLTNLLVAERDLAEANDRLIDALDGLTGRLVMVSNEVGQGVVPVNAMARAFVDHAGLLHQRLAARADRVLFLIAGRPVVLDPHPEAID